MPMRKRGGKLANIKTIGDVDFVEYVKGGNSRQFIYNLDPDWLIAEFVRERMRLKQKTGEVAIEFDLDGHSYRMHQMARASKKIRVELIDEDN